MKNFLLLCLLLITHAASSKSYIVRSEQEFEKISQQVKPGDEVVIATGTYTPWSLTLSFSGTKSQPVLVRGERTGSVMFTGTVQETVFKITGSHITLKGIDFINCTVVKADKMTGSLVELNNSSYCRVTECRFSQNVAKSQYMPIVIISGKGESNQVDNCRFTGNVDNQEVQVKITKETSPQNSLIEKNIFQDKKKVTWPNSNGGECVQVGQDPILLGTVQSHTTVRDNRFIRCNGEPEVISNKSSNNIYKRNYFEQCDGELVMRGGHDCVVDSNTIKGGNSGIRVNGTGHVITNNQITDVKTGIRLMYGMAAGKTDIGFYVSASDCVVKNNRIENATTGIFIGDSKNANWTGKFDTVRYPSRVMQDIAPANNTVADNIFVKTQTEMVKQ